MSHNLESVVNGQEIPHNKYLNQKLKILLSEKINRPMLSIDVVPSKNQALCEYCTVVSKLKHY